MRKLGLALCLFLLGLAPAQPQTISSWPPPAGTIAALCVYNLGAQTYTSGLAGYLQCDSTGKLIVSATFTPSGTQNVDVTKWGAATVGDATAWGTAPTGNVPGVNGNVLAWANGVLGAMANYGTSPGAVLVPGFNAFITNTPTVNPQPSSAAGSASTAASSTTAGSNLVLKASAGNLYDLTVTIGATSGYLMLFDATSLPGNGAVTPVYCAPVTSNGTNGGLSLAWPTPKRFGTGITAGFSTTGCFTLTASTTANFFGGYQ